VISKTERKFPRYLVIRRQARNVKISESAQMGYYIKDLKQTIEETILKITEHEMDRED